MAKVLLLKIDPPEIVDEHAAVIAQDQPRVAAPVARHLHELVQDHGLLFLPRLALAPRTHVRHPLPSLHR